MWTPEIFMECYCVARNKPIRGEITKPQTATVISLWFWSLLAYPELYCDWSVHNQHSWNFSGVHCFLSLTVKPVLEWWHRVVIKSRGPGISPGYYEFGPWLFLWENRRKIILKESPSCLIPCLLVVFVRQLEILVTTLWQLPHFPAKMMLIPACALYRVLIKSHPRSGPPLRI